MFHSKGIQVDIKYLHILPVHKYHMLHICHTPRGDQERDFPADEDEQFHLHLHMKNADIGGEGINQSMH